MKIPETGTKKDRNDINLTEAEDIKKWQEYKEELYRKDLNDLNYHNDVITHIETDIRECEVKWSLGSSTVNKASGGDGMPIELLKILKMILLNCCKQYANKIGKFNSGHRTGSCVFFSIPRRAMPKNVQTTMQLSSVHMPVR